MDDFTRITQALIGLSNEPLRTEGLFALDRIRTRKLLLTETLTALLNCIKVNRTPCTECHKRAEQALNEPPL